jgi:putative RNA 2'-phosphotransferase
MSDPPEVLYHGTVEKFLPSILAQGLVKGERHHVHLSANIETAQKVGDRRGSAIILVVAAQQMVADGHRFFVSENGVWLTDHVPASYLTRLPPKA